MKKIILILFGTLLVNCSSGSNNDNSIVPENPDSITSSNTAPSTTSLVSPTNELLCTENPLKFQWEASDDADGDIITYELQVSKDIGFSELVENININNISTTVSLEPGLEHFWRVRVKDENNAFSDYTEVWKFYTEEKGIVNYLPFTPTLISPIQNTLVSGNEVILEWSSSDVDGDVLTFDVFFGQNNPPDMQLIDFESTTTSFQIQEENTYFWQVKVKDGKDGETLSQLWSFKS